MARIFMDGFEYGGPSLISLATGFDSYDTMWEFYAIKGALERCDWGFSSDAYLSGAYSWEFSCTFVQASYGGARKNLGSTYNKLFSRLYHKDLYAVAQAWCFFALNDSDAFESAQSMQLKSSGSNGNLYLYVGGSLVATATGALQLGTWKLIETMYDNAGSNIVVKVDGATVIDYSGTIDANISHVFVGKSDGATVFDPIGCRIDDFALNDDSGSVNNSWIGAGVIRLLTPTSDDTNADFTPLTGTDHYAMVDDFPDDGDTTYNSSTVSGDIDTFGLESVPSVATGQTINAIQAVYRARSETDVASISPILISGATTDTGTTQSTILSDYYDTKQEVYDVDPNTSAQWTEANVNAVKGGYKNAT